MSRLVAWLRNKTGLGAFDFAVIHARVFYNNRSFLVLMPTNNDGFDVCSF